MHPASASQGSAADPLRTPPSDLLFYLSPPQNLFPEVHAFNQTGLPPHTLWFTTASQPIVPPITVASYEASPCNHKRFVFQWLSNFLRHKHYLEQLSIYRVGVGSETHSNNELLATVMVVSLEIQGNIPSLG